MITKLRVVRYKGFTDFTLRLPRNAVIVGPNSAGKTTLAQALRLASVVLRHAKRRNAREAFSDQTFERYPRSVYGHALSDIGSRQISWYKSENIRHEFREESCGIEITFDNKSLLRIVWPVDEPAFFYLDRVPGVSMRTAAEVRKTMPSVAVVPTLGPVENSEEVLSATHIRESVGTRITSRHFRNQLHQLRSESPEDYNDLKAYLLTNTPEITNLHLVDNVTPGEHTVDLFVTEATGRTEREITWLGDGMQVWLQVLYHVWSNRSAATLVLDEPDVYLHPDLQRRIVGIAEDLPGQSVIATHAPEILTEVGREAVVWVDRSRSTSQRMRDSKALEKINTRLGSGFNLGMARALRSRAVLFVEGADMKILRTIAGTLGAERVKHERGLAVIPLEGFSNWHQVEPFAWLSRDLLGDAVSIHVVLDSDYRTAETIHDLEQSLRSHNVEAHVWRRKELESYLIVPEALARVTRLDLPALDEILASQTELLRHTAQVGFVGRRQKDAERSLDPQTVMHEALLAFDSAWNLSAARTALVPPKDLLAALSREAHLAGGRSFSPRAVASSLKPTEIAGEMADVIIGVERALGAYIG